MFFPQEVVRGEPRVNPRRRFTAATRNHSHLARTSNPSTGRKLGPNRRVQKNAGKRAVFDLGAGGRWTLPEVALPRRFTSDFDPESETLVYVFPLTSCVTRRIPGSKTALRFRFREPGTWTE